MYLCTSMELGFFKAKAFALLDPVPGPVIAQLDESQLRYINLRLKGVSHEFSGGYCYTSIESSLKGLASPCIKF